MLAKLQVGCLILVACTHADVADEPGGDVGETNPQISPCEKVVAFQTLLAPVQDVVDSFYQDVSRFEDRLDGVEPTPADGNGVPPPPSISPPPGPADPWPPSWLRREWGRSGKPRRGMRLAHFHTSVN
jgi:hypothetical protein